MTDAVEDLFERLADASRLLAENSEISLQNTLDDVHRKALLLAAASYFEFRLGEDVQGYCDDSAGMGSPLSNLIRTKAVQRQYHSWFDWKTTNANVFFSLFGENFKRWMKSRIESDAELASGILAFMQIGADRNRLVHQNFGAFSLESSPTEIIERYRTAKRFVERFRVHLHEFTTGLASA